MSAGSCSWCSPRQFDLKRECNAELADWFKQLIAEFRIRFEDAGYPLPPAIDIAIVTVPWRAAPAPGVVLIARWRLSIPVLVIEALAHELVHMASRSRVRHDHGFRACARAVGLEAPWRFARGSASFYSWALATLDRLGPIPIDRVEAKA